MCLLHLSRRTPPGDHKCCCHLCTGASLSRCSSAGTGEFTRGRCELVARPTDVLTLSALCSPCVPRRRPNKQISCQRRDSSPQASRLRLQPARTHRCAYYRALSRCRGTPERQKGGRRNFGHAQHNGRCVCMLVPSEEAALLAEGVSCSGAAPYLCPARWSRAVCGVWLWTCTFWRLLWR